ncbi:MAG: glycosyltransferase family 2 protein, partial [Terriglobia bacterium]
MEISVIIPTFNRAAALTATLETLRAQEGAATLDWEIIVVDNDSTDDTRSATES